MPDASASYGKEYRAKHNAAYYKNHTSKEHLRKAPRTEDAICYRCKRPFRARKDQHPKYSICEPCRVKNGHLTGASRWINARSWI